MFDLQCIEILLSFKERKKHHHWTKAFQLKKLINNKKKIPANVRIFSALQRFKYYSLKAQTDPLRKTPGDRWRD